MQKPTRILLSNDDGYHALGIQTLKKALNEHSQAEIWVIAPDTERSACSQAISLRETLSLKKIKEREFTLNGYPADCVSIALSFPDIFPSFDLILSGINHGANLGNDIHYSGTVAVARQGAIHSKIAVAISLALPQNFQEKPITHFQDSFTHAALWIVNWLKFAYPLCEQGVIYNINIPIFEKMPEEPLALPAVLSKQGHRSYQEHYVILDRTKSEENTEWQVRQEAVKYIDKVEENSDFAAVRSRKISITPLSTYATIRETDKHRAIIPTQQSSV